MTLTYLDHAATTPLDPRVQEIMVEVFSTTFGNPSSLHQFGQAAHAVIEKARRTMADLLRASPQEIIFTSCGTESDNLALRGAAFAAREERGADRILIPPVEHHAVLHTAQQLAELHDFDLKYLPVDNYGRTTPEDVAQHLDSRTAVVSVMFANNEIGTLNPVEEIARVCRDAGIIFHTDAVQAAAHFPIDTSRLPINLLSIGAHKFYGPKGVGALFVRDGTPLLPVQTGGAQEFGIRAATENVPLIAGMAEAQQILYQEHTERNRRAHELRDRLIETVQERIPDVQLTGHPQHRLPNHASFALQHTDNSLLVSLLDAEGTAVSSGSACKTGRAEPSRILEEIGLPPSWTQGALRVTVGQDTTAEEVEHLLDLLPGVVSRVRELS